MIPDEVGAALDFAVVNVLVQFGREHSLAPFDWRIAEYPDGVVIEGRPGGASSDPIADSQGWASALEMIEYAWDEESRPAWHSEQGHWHFEVTSRRD